MSSIDVKEKQLLQEWAAANSDGNVFEQRSHTDTESYFITRNNESTYIMPYQFDTIPQLQEKIAEVSGETIDLQLQKRLAVTAFKCRLSLTQDSGEEEDRKRADRGKLPEFTYAF